MQYKDDRVRLKHISIGVAYPGTARNAGVREAGHELIAFTDGGIELDKDWLKELSLVIAKDSAADVVYGNYAPRADTFFKQCLSMAIVPPPVNKGSGKTRPRFIASSLLKKTVWAAVGGFPDLRAAEDRIFMERIEKRGYVSKYSPNAHVIWNVPGDLKSAFRRFCSYSYHDLLAARTTDWHIPVLKMYAAALLFIMLGIFVSPFFILLPFIGFMLRVIRKMTVNRNEPYFRTLYVPAYFIITGFLIFLVDIAMFTGWVKHIKHILKHPECRGQKRHED